MIHAKHRHIIWDWNGTLLDDLVVCHQIANQIMREMGHPALTLERYRETFRHPIIEFYRVNGIELTEERYMEFSFEFHARYRLRRPDLSIHKDVQDVLKKVIAGGRSQSILSAHPQDLLDFSVRAAGLSDYFARIRGLSTVAAHSKVELGIALMEELEHGPEAVVVIGDTNHDFEVSQAIGAECILVATGFQSRAILDDTGAPVVSSLSELLEFL